MADFGLSEDVYARNYFRQGRQGEDGEAPVKLPVRWMAVESLNDRLFTEKTDVVRCLRSNNYSDLGAYDIDLLTIIIAKIHIVCMTLLYLSVERGPIIAVVDGIPRICVYMHGLMFSKLVCDMMNN